MSIRKTSTVLDSFLTKWHKMLALQRQAPSSWHRSRLREEFVERRDATTTISRLSESSDVFFCISRAMHDRFPIVGRPTFTMGRNGVIYLYMMGKYSSRWAFYRTAAFLCEKRARLGAEAVNEVVNPRKDANLDVVAGRHGIDPVRFRRVGGRLRCVWPLFP